jgi:hypothetical protein
LCVDCVGKVIGRPHTLYDQEVSNYLKPAPNMANIPGFMQPYIRATIVGAYNATGTPIPEGWAQPTAQPNLDAMKIKASNQPRP